MVTEDNKYCFFSIVFDLTEELCEIVVGNSNLIQIVMAETLRPVISKFPLGLIFFNKTKKFFKLKYGKIMT